MSTKIGQFEVLSELSKSATGGVYKVNDPQSSQTVALKVIRLAAFNDCAADVKTCLLEECDRAKTLSSPNLTAASFAEETEGEFCATMEYIQGNSVATMLARKEGFSIWDLLDIGRQVCSGLDHAHAKKIFHYSLEPAKIMCGWDGTVRVIGFGVSSIGRFSGVLPSPGPIVYYMSPEQIRGGMVDARSNIFSLGALFYEMVTDEKAFSGGDSESLSQSIFESTPVAPIEINPKLHPLLSNLILKALSKDPDERYQSGRELLDDLEQCKETKAQAAKAPAAAPKPAAVVPAANPVAPAKFATPANAAPSVPSGVVGAVGGRPPLEKKFSASAPVTAPAAASTAVAQAAAPRRATPVAGSKPSTSQPNSSQASQPVNRKSTASASASMSASSVLDEPQVETFTAGPVKTQPKIAVDPMMAESASSSGKGVSFSEMTELPPLKEIYIAPPPPPAPAAAQPLPAVDFRSRGADEDKPKIQPREVAQKAIQEIKGVPPSLMVYSIAGAAAVILIIAIALVMHINHLNTDEDSARPTAALASPYSAQPAPAQPAQQSTQQESQAQPAQSDSAPASEPQPETANPQPTTGHAAVAARARGSKKNKAAAPPAAPVILPGQVAIDSTPEGAQFQIDGRTDPSWVTPFTITSLNPGQHTVTVTKAGYGADTRTVEVPSGSKAFVVTHLNQLMATLSVTSTPAGANVYIDGKDIGKLTPAQVPVDKGQHTVLVRKAGFIDETTSAQFILSQTVSFSPTLRPLGNVDNLRTVNKVSKLFGGKDEKGMGSVFVRTQPKGAQVAVNQHMVGRNSPVDFMLDPGNYMIDITLTGYTPIHKVITVDKGGKAVIDEVMTHE